MHEMKGRITSLDNIITRGLPKLLIKLGHRYVYYVRIKLLGREKSRALID